MKKHFLLLALLTSLSLSGCDAFDSFFDDKPVEQQDSEEKEKQSDTDDEEKDKEDKGDDDEEKDKEEPVALESISVEGNLVKKQYYVNDEWSSEGLRVDGHYSNGEIKTLNSDEYELGFTPYKAFLNTTEVTVTARLQYDDLPCENRKFDVEVFEPIPQEKEIISLEIKGDLANKIYKENDKWDSNGLTVEATFDDNSTANLTSEDYIFIFNPTSAVKGTTSVSVKAKLSDSEIESNPRVFDVEVKTEHTVSFDGNGATSGSMADVKTIETSYQVPSCLYQKDGYTFDGWALNSASGVKYDVGDYITLSSNVILYATWQLNPPTPVEYTISFNGNGATSGSMDTIKTSDSTYTAPSCSFLKTGYIFNGWALNSASGTKYNVGEPISLTSSITLYATWIPNGSSEDFDGYYSSIDTSKTGKDLKDQLNNKIKITDSGWSYNGLWDAYETTDTRPDGYLWDIYSDQTHYTASSPHSGKGEGNYVNREHIIPQSTFSEKIPMKSDAHHVLPSDGHVNGQRSSWPHGNVDTDKVTYTSNDGCKLGTGTGGGTVFEPKDCYKGDIARIYLYFVTCYQHLLGSDIKNTSYFPAFDFSTYKSFKQVYLSVYIQWAKEDEVSQKEIDRNNAIFEKQGNRNPYIDHPEWVEQVFGN